MQVNWHRVRPTAKIYIVREVELVASENTSGFKFVQKVGSKAVKLRIVLHDILQILERLEFFLAGLHIRQLILRGVNEREHRHGEVCTRRQASYAAS